MSWPEFQLMEVASVFNGKTPSQSEQRSEGRPILKIKDVDVVDGFKEFNAYVDDAFYATHANKKLNALDTLILNAAHNASHVASKSYLVPSTLAGVIATGEWLIARADPGQLDGRFLHYFLTSPQVKLQLKEAVKGIHLYPKDVERISIPLPPLPTQCRIAAVLDKAQALVANDKRTLVLYDQLAKSLFLEMFGDIRTNERTWKTAALSSLMTRVTVGYVGPLTAEYIEHGILLLRSLNIRRNYLDLLDVRYVSDDFHRRQAKSMLSPGDVAVIRTGSAGRACVIPESMPVANCADLIVITPDQHINPYFLAEMINLKYGDADSIQGLTGAIQKHFNIGAVKKEVIPCPPLELQEQYASHLKKITFQASHAETSLRQSEALFGSLLQGAFNEELK